MWLGLLVRLLDLVSPVVVLGFRGGLWVITRLSEREVSNE